MVVAGEDGVRRLAEVPAVTAQQRGVAAVPVSDLQIVVETVPARLNVKVPALIYFHTGSSMLTIGYDSAEIR